MNEVLRDSGGIAHIVSLSGGKDSTALALGLMEKMPDTPFNYVCTPTGNELPIMVDHWKNLSNVLKSPIITVTNGTLKSIILDQNMIPNWQKRFCTRILKLRAMGEFLRTIKPAVCYVGLRADEPDDERGGAVHGGDYITKLEAEEVRQVYPMRDWGWEEVDVRQKCMEYQIRIPDRTDCAWCYYQKIGEWYNLWKDNPEIFAEGARLEREIGHHFRSASRDSWPAWLDELAIEFERGRVPERSLKMMELRNGMCRACTL